MGLASQPMPADAMQLCQQEIGAAGLCCHALQIPSPSSQAAGATGLPELLVARLRALFQWHHACPAVSFWLKGMVVEVSCMLEKRLNEQDLLHDAFKLQQHPGGGRCKRQRLDEDFKLKMAGASQAGMASSSGAQCRALGEKRNSYKWDTKDLNLYMRQCWRVFEKVKTITLAQDASKLGNPGEDTMVYAAFSPDLHCGIWLPPQAPALNLTGD